jgi:hypothetical protein
MEMPEIFNPNVDSEKLLRPLDNFNSRPFSKKCLSKHLTSLHFTLPSLVKKKETGYTKISSWSKFVFYTSKNNYNCSTTPWKKY